MALGEGVFAAAWREGLSLSREWAISTVLDACCVRPALTGFGAQSLSLYARDADDVHAVTRCTPFFEIEGRRRPSTTRLRRPLPLQRGLAEDKRLHDDVQDRLVGVCTCRGKSCAHRHLERVGHCHVKTGVLQRFGQQRDALLLALVVRIISARDVRLAPVASRRSPADPSVTEVRHPLTEGRGRLIDRGSRTSH